MELSMIMANDDKQPDGVDRDSPTSPAVAAPRAAHERTPDSRSMWRAIRDAVVQQLVMLFISANVLDGGDVFRLCTTAALLSWLMIAVIGFGRLFALDRRASKLELATVRYGFWVFFIGMWLLYHYQLLPHRWYFANRVLDSHPWMKHATPSKAVSDNWRPECRRFFLGWSS
jgi:hypothetical protein